MTVETVNSEYAAIHIHHMLDASVTGNVYVIERARQPTAVVMGYEQWRSIQKRLRELELLEMARQVDNMIEQGEMGTISHDDLKRLMLERRAQEAVAHVVKPLT